MPNYRPTEPVDWKPWCKAWREYWTSLHKERPNGYYRICEFPSEKLRILSQIESDLADGYDPRPNLIHYVEDTDRHYPSDGYSPLQRQMLKQRGRL